MVMLLNYKKLMKHVHDIDIHPLHTLFEYGPYLMIIATFIYTKHSFLFLSLVASNILLNTILKNIIKQPRPVPTNEYGELQAYGMPSGHAQIVWFIWLYNMTSPYDIQQPIFLTICNTVLAVGTSLQRYYTKRHTPLQILAGFTVGILVCALFVVYYQFINP